MGAWPAKPQIGTVAEGLWLDDPHRACGLGTSGLLTITSGPPGTDVGTLDQAYLPPAPQNSSLRRRPAGERTAA
jgi:hypothetical protein